MRSYPDVDAYIAESVQWPEEMATLRRVIVGCGLTEAIKWGKPCFGHDGKNIVIFQEFKEYLSLMFFKGALLRDPAGVLHEQGPNSRSARRIQITSVAQAVDLSSTVEAYVEEAIAVEDAGLVVEPAPDVVLVDELRQRLESDPQLEAAFEALTPGRRREYHLYVSGAKQSITRQGRVDTCVPQILDGKGLRDR